MAIMSKRLDSTAIKSTGCDCGADRETPEHILLVCPKYARQRLQICPEGFTLHNVIWGTGDNLRLHSLPKTLTPQLQCFITPLLERGLPQKASTQEQKEASKYF